MSETDTSKVYMMPDNNSCMEAVSLASMMNNNNNWANNPFMYLIWLAFFGGNGFGFGNRTNTAQNEDLSRQLQTLQSSVTDNHNNDLAMQAITGNGKALTDLAGNLNVGVATLGSAISSIKGAIDLVGSQNGLNAERVINSVLLGNKDLVQQIATCCCENKQLVTTMGYEGQLRDQANTASVLGRLDQLSNGIATGFSSTAYETQTQTNQLSRDLQNQTQTIIDKISTMEANAQQDKINNLTAQLTAANSRAERQAELQPIIAQLNAIKAAQPATATIQYPNLVAYPSYLSNNIYGTNTFWS